MKEEISRKVIIKPANTINCALTKQKIYNLLENIKTFPWFAFCSTVHYDFAKTVFFFFFSCAGKFDISGRIIQYMLFHINT